MCFVPSQHRLKVGELWQPWKASTTAAARLRLNGQWLTEAGFPPGSEVIVHNTDPGRIVLTADAPVLYPYQR